MREIKFRAWDGDYKEMLDGNAIEEAGEDMPAPEDGSYFRQYYTGLSYGALFVGFYDSKCDWQNCEVMQFTGLLDKNGKEIYEGDVVKWYVNDVTRSGIVEYVDEWGGFDLKNFHDEYHVCNDWLRGEYEILGNIHENPELLEVK